VTLAAPGDLNWTPLNAMQPLGPERLTTVPPSPAWVVAPDSAVKESAAICW
jgi:hypothetical protein